MTPVLFPFGELDESKTRMLLDLWGGIAVWSAGRKFLQGGLAQGDPRIHLHVPAGVTEREVDAALEVLRQTAEFQGKDGILTLLEPEASDTEDALSLSREILGGGLPEGEKGKEGAQLVEAAVLLVAAARHDEETAELAARLAQVERLEAAMLSELKGNMPAEDGPGERKDRCRISARLASWARLFSAAPGSSCLWVTDCREVVVELQDRFPEMVRPDRGTVPFLPETGGEGFREIWHLPGLSPLGVCHRIVEGASDAGEALSAQGVWILLV